MNKVIIDEKNKKDLNSENILEEFEKIEKKLNLDKSLMFDIPWWESTRSTVWQVLKGKLGIQGEENSNFKKNLNQRLKLHTSRFLKDIINIFSSKSPLKIKKNSYLIWGHPRRQFDNGIYVDIYSDSFISLFPSSDNFAVIEMSKNYNHLSPAKTKNIYYGEYILNSFASILSLFQRQKLNTSEKDIIIKLENELWDKFSCKINVFEIVKSKLSNWKGVYWIMKIFLRLKNPEIFFIVNSNGCEAIIAACKSECIKTVELQHGSPLKGKLNYDYSSGISKKFFPDKFLSFGQFWNDNCHFPINKNHIINFGNAYLFEQLKKYSHIKKEKKLAVVSELTHIRELVQFAIAIKKKFQNDLIVEFKPHPSEYFFEHQDYFDELKKNEIIISPKNKSLYEVFASSRWQVAVGSTGLFEGLYFDAFCFLLKKNKLFKAYHQLSLLRSLLIALNVQHSFPK